MEKNLFTKPLTLDVLQEISQYFVRHKHAWHIHMHDDERIRWGIDCGSFTISILDREIISAVEKSYPFLVLKEKGYEFVESNTKLKEYLVLVVRLEGIHTNKIYFCDVSDTPTTEFVHFKNEAINSVSVIPQRKPRIIVGFKDTPINVVVLIPHIANSRKNIIGLLVAHTQNGSILLDFLRKKNDSFFAYSHEFRSLN